MPTLLALVKARIAAIVPASVIDLRPHGVKYLQLTARIELVSTLYFSYTKDSTNPALPTLREAMIAASGPPA